MKPATLLFLFLVACGGEPFELSAAVMPDADTADGGGVTRHDAAVEGSIDAFTADVIPHDALTADVSAFADVAADTFVCTPYPTASFPCIDGVSPVDAPARYCVAFATTSTASPAWTPAACQCATTYTCACIEAAGGGDAICQAGAPGWHVTGCQVTGNGITVTCSP